MNKTTLLLAAAAIALSLLPIGLAPPDLPDDVAEVDDIDDVEVLDSASSADFVLVSSNLDLDTLDRLAGTDGLVDAIDSGRLLGGDDDDDCGCFAPNSGLSRSHDDDPIASIAPASTSTSTAPPEVVASGDAWLFNSAGTDTFTYIAHTASAWESQSIGKRS